MYEIKWMVNPGCNWGYPLPKGSRHRKAGNAAKAYAKAYRNLQDHCRAWGTYKSPLTFAVLKDGKKIEIYAGPRDGIEYIQRKLENAR